MEGDCEKIVIESAGFKTWASAQGIQICKPVLDTIGSGNLLRKNIEPLVDRLRTEKPDHIVILTDCEESTVEDVVMRIGTAHTDLIFIAVNALEAWFLADSEAMQTWSGVASYHEEKPEETTELPWLRPKEIAANLGTRGPGISKPMFAQRMVKYFGFLIARAAAHPRCPIATRFTTGLKALR